jgi:hypothetical protein
MSFVHSLTKYHTGYHYSLGFGKCAGYRGLLIPRAINHPRMWFPVTAWRIITTEIITTEKLPQEQFNGVSGMKCVSVYLL